MKRELAFALEVQPEMAGSLGRNRASQPQALSSVQTSSPVVVSESVNGERLKCSLSGECLIVYTRRKKPRLGYFDGFSEKTVSKDSACSEVSLKSDSIEPSCNVGVEECEKNEDGFEEKPIYNSDEFIDEEDTKRKLKPSLIDEGDVQWTEVVINEEIDCLDLDMSTEYSVEVEVIENGLSVPEVEMSESALGVDTEAIGEGSALTATKKNLELKMSKKILLNKKPSTVKELFETGLLEGVPVVYMGGRKAFGLRGWITDVGILCSCSLCKGRSIIPPSQFEIHACKSYKRASQYICFENGKSLLEVLKICRGTPLHMLETAVQKALNSLPTEETLACKRCKGSFPAKYFGKGRPVCQSCAENEPQCISPHTTIEITRSPKPGPVPKFPKTASVRSFLDEPPCRSTPRSSKSVPMPKSMESSSPCVSSDNKNQWNKTKKSVKPFVKSKSSGKATEKSKGKILKRSVKPIVKSKISRKASEKSLRKISKRDQRLHKLVFEEGGLPDGSEVAYFGCGQKLIDGYKTASGIFCCCCNSEVSPSQFEAHAGWGSRRKPYSYIYTSNGVSLHELALSLSRGRKYSSKDNDSLCTICLDGGNLLLCDGCPRAFHKECASLPSVPHGDWYCIYCQNMFQSQKFVEFNVNAVAAGRMSGVDPIEDITRRCIQIVGDIAAEISGCSLCKAHDFCKTGFGPRTVILCDQCEKEYHVGCLRSKKMADLKEIPKGDWFCSMDCTRINSTLHNLVARGVEILPNSIGIIRSKFTERGLDSTDDLNVTWRVLSGRVTSPKTRLLLSEAIAIFHASFDPINDLLTGKDLIPSMVYGRNTKGHELRGMYCAVLMVNSHVESAAIFRVFGQEVAELPLVATRKGNHGKGYFQVLYSSIENLLASLKVSNIVLPAAEEAVSIWADKFGFTKMKPDQLSRYKKCWRQMLTFHGTTMLEKMVPECQIVQTAECIEEPTMVGG